ncbi:MAG: dipeptidase PepE [Euryarchaeota archaeon]|nr:dipeptidase PepE [Euryarchaeota archaeon]
MMRLLLGSGGLRTPERRQIYFEEMSLIFEDCNEVVFIPYASSNHIDYTARLSEFSAPSGIVLRNIDEFENPIAAIEQAEGLYVGGGNTFLLTQKLHANGLIEVVRKRVIEGMPYMGVSAGSNVACPTMQTTNDMPIVNLESFKTFDLVPFQINAHYHDGNIWLKDGDEFEPHFGETRAQRIQEFHEHNQQSVIGLWEGSFLRWEDDQGLLLGGNATVFHPGEQPVTHQKGVIFNRQLFIHLR